MSASFFKELWRRRVPQIFGIYLAVGWGILEFADWLVNRYVLSPHLIDLALVAWATMIPTVLLISWYHGAPGRDRWTKAEKIGVPLNIAFAAVVMIAAFGGRSLGAATTSVTVKDEAGATVQRTIPKSEFRKRVAVFYFDNESGDTTLDWLSYAIPLGIQDDLLQDMFIVVRTAWPFFSERLDEAGYPEGVGLPLTLQKQIADELHLDYFVSGRLSGGPDALSVTTGLYETRRGKLQQERSFTGRDLFEVIDQSSTQLKRDLELPEQHIEETDDLPFAEIMTGSPLAYRRFISGWRALEAEDWDGAARGFAAAAAEDPSYSYANLMLYVASLFRNDSETMVSALEAAMQHSYKLPERYRFTMKAAYYRFVKQDPEKTLAVANMHAELFPEDILAHQVLLQLYAQQGDREKAIASAERILELDPGEFDMLRTIGELYQAMGQFARAASYFERYAQQFPEDPEAFNDLGDLSRIQGEHEAALDYYERALLLDPANVSVIIDIARTEGSLGRLAEAKAQLEDALATASTPAQRAQAFGALRGHHQRRGELGRAIEHLQQFWAELEKVQPPIVLAQVKLSTLDTYVIAGQEERAFAVIEEVEAQLDPPFDQIPAIGRLVVALELEDAPGIEGAVGELEQLIAALGVELLRPDVLFARGRLLEIRDDPRQAIIAYERALELRPTDVGVRTDIGRSYRKLGEYAQAKEQLERVLEVQPFSPRGNLELAKVLAESGRREEAMPHLQRALSVWENADPEFQPAQEARALQAQLTAGS